MGARRSVRSPSAWSCSSRSFIPRRPCARTRSSSCCVTTSPSCPRSWPSTSRRRRSPVTPNSWTSSSSSPEQTEAAGARLAAGLHAGDVVLVSGELGSGKTTFVRGACRALGVTANVTSPTFTIGQLFAGSLDVAALDLYRLDGAEPGLLDDYLTPDRIGFLEWPELAEPELERVTARVRIEHAGADRRTITVE